MLISVSSQMMNNLNTTANGIKPVGGFSMKVTDWILRGLQYNQAK